MALEGDVNVNDIISEVTTRWCNLVEFLVCDKITLAPSRLSLIIGSRSPSNMMWCGLSKDHLINVMLTVIGNLVE